MDNYEEKVNEVAEAIKLLSKEDFTKAGKPNINKLTSIVKFSVTSGMLEDAVEKNKEKEDEEVEETEELVKSLDEDEEVVEEVVVKKLEKAVPVTVEKKLEDLTRMVHNLREEMDRIYLLLVEKKPSEIVAKPAEKFKIALIGGAKVKMYINQKTGEKTFEDCPETRKQGLKIKE